MNVDNGVNSTRPLQVCIFDQRRGDKEGEEEDKVIAYYPSDVSSASQTATVGLAQAFISFSSTFEPEEACDSIWTSNGRWILHTSETHLWLMLIASNDWLKGQTSEDSLSRCLAQLQNLIQLTCGPIQNLLDEDPSGQVARSSISGIINEFGEHLMRSRGADYQKLSNPLAMYGPMPLLRLPHTIFGQLQSVVHSLEMLPAWNGSQIMGILALHEFWLLYSTLSKEDTLSLYQLVNLAILPAIKAGKASSLAKRWSSGKGEKQRNVLHRSAWTLNNDGFVTLSNPKIQPGRVSSTGSLSSIVEADKILPVASIWLNAAKEWCSLLILNRMDELLVVVLPEKIPATVSVAENCMSASEDILKSLTSSVSHHLQSVRRYHVPSYRYLFVDDVTDSFRASPGNKVATLAKQSLSLTSSVRSQIEERLKKNKEGFLEVAVWGQNDCWVVAKCRGNRRLFVVLEQRGNEGLIESCKWADSFGSTQFPGLFD